MTDLQKYRRDTRLEAIAMFGLDVFETIACLVTSVRYPNIVGALVIIAALILEITINISSNDNDFIKKHRGFFSIFSMGCAIITIFALLIMLFMVSPFSPYHQA